MLEGVDELPRVSALINYLDEPAAIDPTRRLEYRMRHPDKSNLRLKPYRVSICDLRSRRDSVQLDEFGFCLAGHCSTVDDLTDVERARETYAREVEELITTLTGADLTICADVQLRFSEVLNKENSAMDPFPARFVHGDFIGDSGQDMLRLFPIDSRDYGRTAVFNVWRVVTPPPQDLPLAICDMRTVAADDSVAVMATFDEGSHGPLEFRMAAYKYRPEHAWYYFSNMTSEEALVFKTYESDPSRCYCAPHTAFEDTARHPNAIPRGSIEARVLALFR